MSKIDRVRREAKQKRSGFVADIEAKNFKAPTLKYKKLILKFGERVGGGQNCTVYRCDQLAKIYDRKNLCVKIFRNSKTQWGYNNVMGQSSILECTVIQNLMSLRGLAPRVYDLIEVDNKIAQITDLVKGENKAVPISDSRFCFHEPEIKQDHQFIDGKLVDFQGAIFRNFMVYKKSVLTRVAVHSQPHSGEGKLYQSTNYLDGWRDTQARLDRWKLPDMKGLHALDIGCNAGIITRKLCDLGCVRVVGIDWSQLIEPVRELAIIDGYFNIDFYGADLRHMSWEKIQEMTGIKKFDVALFLAMENHIGNPEWLKNFKMLVYEGHGQELERTFKIIKM